MYTTTIENNNNNNEMNQFHTKGKYLQDLIIEYQLKKWISNEKANALLKVIKEATSTSNDIDVDANTTEQALKLVQKSIDKISRRHKNNNIEHNQLKVKKDRLNKQQQQQQQPYDVSIVSDMPTIISELSEQQKIMSNKLMNQIKEYRNINWITEKKANAYLKILTEANAHNMDINTVEQAFTLIQRSLQKVKHRFQAITPLPPSSSSSDIDNTTNNITHDTSSISFMPSSTINNPRNTTNIILSPDEISLQQISIQVDSLTKNNIAYDDAIANSFVEMCFFARLGFIQPPCCLKCAHATTISTSNDKPQQEQHSCQRYVTWRKDANSILRPDNLQSNIVLVPCYAIDLLFNGDIIDGWKWDLDRKRFYQIHHIGKE